MGFFHAERDSWLREEMWHDITIEGVTAPSLPLRWVCRLSDQVHRVSSASLCLLPLNLIRKELYLDGPKITDLSWLFYYAPKSQLVSGEEGSHNQL